MNTLNTPNVTDAALFGTAEPRPIIAPPTHRPEPASVDVAAKAKTESKSTDTAMVAFRIQQSLCLFPLNGSPHQDHHNKYSDKLKHLLKERGLMAPDKTTERDAILNELRRQTTIMKEALTEYVR